MINQIIDYFVKEEEKNWPYFVQVGLGHVLVEDVERLETSLTQQACQLERVYVSGGLCWWHG